MHKLVAATAAVVFGLGLAAAGTAHADPRPAPRVLQYWYDPTLRDCAESGVVMIQLDQPVSAVIASWSTGALGDPMTEYVIAAHSDPDLGSVITFGDDYGCFVSSGTIPIGELTAGGHLELTGLRADGTRAVVRGLPSHIAIAEMPSDGAGLGRALRNGLNVPSYGEDDQIVPQVPADWNPMRGIDTALWAGLCVCLLVAGGCIVLFRRRPALRAPTE